MGEGGGVLSDGAGLGVGEGGGAPEATWMVTIVFWSALVPAAGSCERTTPWAPGASSTVTWTVKA